jgi:uncharacterized damage-inducible protein DinB
VVRRVFCLVGLLWLCLPLAASAQEKPPAPLITPTSGARLEFLDEVSFYEQRYIRLAEAIPEEKYNWHPGEGVRSIGEVFAHIASANYTFAKMLGTATPANVDLKVIAASAGDKAKDIQALKDSFLHFRNAILAIKDSELDKEIKGPRGQTTIRGSFFLIDGHFGEHLGQSIAYARSVGIVPPWTQERQRQEPDKAKPTAPLP